MNKKWQQKFLFVAGGQAVSLLGSHGVQFALIWWLAARTDSALMLGLAGLVAYLPQMVLAPLAGSVCDRFDRRWVSAIADLSMGTLACTYAFALAHWHLPAWTVLVMLGVRGIGDTFQEPAIQSLLPQLVPPAHLAHANGWLQMLRGGAFLFGPMIGAGLYTYLPLPWVLISDLFGAMIGATALLAVKVPHLAAAPTALPDWRAGLAVYRADRHLLTLLVASGVTMCWYAPLSALYPLMTSGYFKLSAGFGGLVEASFAIGMLASAGLFASVIKMRRYLRWSWAGIVAMGLSALGGGMMPASFGGWFGFVLCCGLLGAASNLHMIPLTTYIQRNVPADRLGRALAVQSMSNGLAMPLGLVIASPLAAIIGVNHWFTLAGGGMLIVAAITAWWLR